MFGPFPSFLGQFFFFKKSGSVTHTCLSINILHAGNKSPVQRGFFANSMGDLLPTLGFLGELYNFCNFVIIFSLIKSRWYVEVVTYFTDLEMIEYYQKRCSWNRSLQKLKATKNITPDTLC